MDLKGPWKDYNEETVLKYTFNALACIDTVKKLLRSSVLGTKTAATLPSILLTIGYRGSLNPITAYTTAEETSLDMSSKTY